MSNMKFFKGGKSKATKGLARFSELLVPRAELLLVQDEASKEWGFDLDHAGEMLAKMTATEEAVEDSTAAAEEGEQVDTTEPDEEIEVPVAAGNMFAAIGSTLATVASNPAPAATRTASAPRTAYTIEKDRPMQNGIKRPSSGGLCRAVWDACDEQREQNGGDTPTTQQVRDLALMNNWNTNNAMIEYYQWRKYNGITGRAKKVEAPTPVAPVAPVVTPETVAA